MVIITNLWTSRDTMVLTIAQAYNVNCVRSNLCHCLLDPVYPVSSSLPLGVHWLVDTLVYSQLVEDHWYWPVY